MLLISLLVVSLVGVTGWALFKTRSYLRRVDSRTEGFERTLGKMNNGEGTVSEMLARQLTMLTQIFDRQSAQNHQLMGLEREITSLTSGVNSLDRRQRDLSRKVTDVTARLDRVERILDDHDLVLAESE